MTGHVAEARPADLAKGLGRGFGGALLFAVPLFLTMEVWQLGVSLDRWRLVLLLLATAVLAVNMESYFGMLDGGSPGVVTSMVDAGMAFLVGLVAAGSILTVLAVLVPFDGWQQRLSVVVLAALPATVGASFARSRLSGSSGGGAREGEPEGKRYRHELFLMVAGAVVFASSVAPTQEVVRLGGTMTPVHGIAVVCLVLLVMHGFVYWLDFRGGSGAVGGFWPVFVRFTVVGFVLALAVSAFLLWVLGRFDGTGLLVSVHQTLVLVLPASLGAAAARLIL